MSEVKQVLAYYRVSTTQQQLERQQIKVKRRCKELGYHLVEEYSEKISGTIEVRDALTQLMNHVKKGGIDMVVIDELSRFGRNETVITQIKEIHKHKVGFYSIKENILTDVSNPAGIYNAELFIGIISSINIFELSTTKYRTMEGRNRQVINGNVVGSLNICYGYMKDKNKKMIINLDEAEVVKKVYELFLEGNGTTKIAKYLNEHEDFAPTRTKTIQDRKLNKKGYSFGRKWADVTVWGMLTNSVYKGDRKYKGDIYFDEKYKIIEPDVWDNVQVILKSRYNKVGNTNTNFNYIISRNKMFCGICGKSYFPHKRSPKNGLVGKDNRYICLSTRDRYSSVDEKCDNVGISIDKVEKLIQEVIFFILKDKLLVALDNTEINNNISVLEEELKILDNEFLKKDKVRLNIIDWALDGSLPKEIVYKKKDEVEKELTKIEDNKTKIKKRISEFKTTKKNILDIEKMRKSFQGGEKIPKEIVDKIIEKIIVTRKDVYPEAFNKVKGDKIVEIKIIAANRALEFLISQRTKEVYYMSGEFGYFPMSKFFDETLPKKAFDFVTGA